MLRAFITTKSCGSENRIIDSRRKLTKDFTEFCLKQAFCMTKSCGNDLPTVIVYKKLQLAKISSIF